MDFVHKDSDRSPLCWSSVLHNSAAAFNSVFDSSLSLLRIRLNHLRATRVSQRSSRVYQTSLNSEIRETRKFHENVFWNLQKSCNKPKNQCYPPNIFNLALIDVSYIKSTIHQENQHHSTIPYTNIRSSSSNKVCASALRSLTQFSLLFRK